MSSPINICFITSTLRRSGPSSQLKNIIKHLPEMFNPVVLTLSPEPVGDTLIDDYYAENIRVESLNLSRIDGMLSGKKRVREFLLENQVQFVHTQGIRADAISASGLTKYPRVATIRNNAYDDYPAKFGKLQGYIMAFQHTNALRKLKYATPCSHALGKILEHRLGKRNAIPNGVDIERYNIGSEESVELTKKNLGITAGQKVYVMVGSLIQRKSPETVIKAFVRLKDENVTLLVLGGGPMLGKCQEISDGAITNFIFGGHVDNVSECLKACQTLVSASLSEGLPNTVMEALASGLDVILSDIPPHRELEESVGARIVKIFKTEDVDGLCEILNTEEKVTDPVEIRSTAIQSLDAKIMSARYVDLYNHVLANEAVHV